MKQSELLKDWVGLGELLDAESLSLAQREKLERLRGRLPEGLTIEDAALAEETFAASGVFGICKAPEPDDEELIKRLISVDIWLVTGKSTLWILNTAFELWGIGWKTVHIYMEVVFEKWRDDAAAIAVPVSFIIAKHFADIERMMFADIAKKNKATPNDQTL